MSGFTVLETELENQAYEYAKKEDFDCAAVALKSIEMMNELKAMQIALVQNNRNKIKEFIK